MVHRQISLLVIQYSFAHFLYYVNGTPLLRPSLIFGLYREVSLCQGLICTIKNEVYHVGLYREGMLTSGVVTERSISSVEVCDLNVGASGTRTLVRMCVIKGVCM